MAMIVAVAEILGEKNFNDAINKKMIFWLNCVRVMLIFRRHHPLHHPVSKNKKGVKGKRQMERKKMKMKPTGRNRQRNGSTDKFITCHIYTYEF